MIFALAAAGSDGVTEGMGDPVLELENLRFAWPGSPAPCLDIAELVVGPGETIFVHGPSGCGKSTLLSLLAGVLLPQGGRIAVQGVHWGDMGQVARDRHRVDHVGYIFQQFNLLPYLGVVDNAGLPCQFSASRRSAAIRRSGSARAEAQTWLEAMGLDHALWRRASRELSVGQQQRVAAARALVGQPALVIADEPTSALDEDRRAAFLDLLLSACAQARSALVFVSHDQRMAPRFSRTVHLPSINRVAHGEGAAA